jgi:pilus assembly protein CpaD
MPNCPGWSATSTVQFNNATSAGFGCSVNGNLAAMVADPQHLLEGADGTGLTSVMTATKAISTYRGMEPTGANGLPVISSRGGEGE